MYNHVFSSRPATMNLTTSLSDEPAKDLDKPYRKGFYGEGRANWDHVVEPLDPSQNTALTRRQDAQQAALPDSANIKYTATLDDRDIAAEIEKKQARLQRRRRRAKHKQDLLRQKKAAHKLSLDNPSSSSSSSDSSSGSDS